MNNEKKINFDPNTLFFRMATFIKEMKTKEFWVQGVNNGKGGYTTKRPVIVNMGGTRSAKTWDFFSLLFFVCSKNVGRGLDIRIFRNTLDDCRQKTFKDFKECLNHIGFYDEKKLSGFNAKPVYNLFGNSVTFMGVPEDENIEGFASDICFFNEVLETKNQNFVNGMIDRIRLFSVMDSNPSKTSHFVFNYEHRDNVLYTHTTWRDNKHLSTAQIADITKYAPYLDDEVEYRDNKLYYQGKIITKEHHPPVNEYNARNGTINQRRYQIYDRGCKGSVDGLIFDRVQVSDNRPNIPFSYGMDFGFTTDPTSLTRNWEDKKNIYIELLIYEPFKNPDVLSQRLALAGVEPSVRVTCDSSDRYVTVGSDVRMIRDLRKKGWRNVKGVKKNKDIAYWVQSMNTKNIVIVKNDIPAPAWVKTKYGFEYMWEILVMEFDGYVWWTKGEMSMETPDPDCVEHAIDSARYRHMFLNQSPKLSFNKN